MVNISHPPHFALTRPPFLPLVICVSRRFLSHLPPPTHQGPLGGFRQCIRLLRLFGIPIITAHDETRPVHLDQPASACITRSTHAILQYFYITVVQPHNVSSRTTTPADFKHHFRTRCFIYILWLNRHLENSTLFETALFTTLVSYSGCSASRIAVCGLFGITCPFNLCQSQPSPYDSTSLSMKSASSWQALGAS